MFSEDVVWTWTASLTEEIRIKMGLPGYLWGRVDDEVVIRQFVATVTAVVSRQPCPMTGHRLAN